MTSRIPGTPRARDLLADDDLLDRAQPLAADVDRPGDAGQAALGQLALPAPAGVDVGVVLGAGARAARLGRLRLVLLQPGAHLLAVLGLLGRVVEVHAAPLADWPVGPVEYT